MVAVVAPMRFDVVCGMREVEEVDEPVKRARDYCMEVLVLEVGGCSVLESFASHVYIWHVLTAM